MNRFKAGDKVILNRVPIGLDIMESHGSTCIEGKVYEVMQYDNDDGWVCIIGENYHDGEWFSLYRPKNVIGGTLFSNEVRSNIF